MALPFHRSLARDMITRHTALVAGSCGGVVAVGALTDTFGLALVAAVIVSIVGLIVLRHRVTRALSEPLAHTTSVTQAIADGAVSGRRGKSARRCAGDVRQESRCRYHAP